MKPKLLFFDIDDTLTSEVDGKVPQSAIAAILQSQRAGHRVYVNTGRCLQTVAKEIRTLPFDGYVCGCGTAIYDGAGRKVWHYKSERKLSFLPSVEKLQELAVRYGGDVLLEGEDAMAFLAGGEELTAGAAYHLEDYKHRSYRFCDVSAPTFSFNKFSAWFKSRENFEGFREALGDCYMGIDRGFSRNSYLGEFVPLGYTKASGIRQVCRLHGIEEMDCFVFGDSNNDLAMFACSATKVVMGNSKSEELRKRADYITAKASEDGIAKALEYFGLLQGSITK